MQPSGEHGVRITLGVSLKAYLGFRQTVSWAAGVAEVIAGHRPGLELFVLPSYPALAEVKRILAGTGVGLGAQNLAADDFGAQTGEVTGAMLVELGCRYVAGTLSGAAASARVRMWWLRRWQRPSATA